MLTSLLKILDKMTSSHSTQKEDDEFKKATFIWEEYKYRHELVWKLIIQLTLAIVAVSIIPYLPDTKIGERVGPVLVALPFIGLVLGIITTFRIARECNILDRIREEHRKFHKKMYNISYEDSVKRSPFTREVIMYFRFLIILCALNFVIILLSNFACK